LGLLPPYLFNIMPGKPHAKIDVIELNRREW